jgi:acyl-CoA synthetase (AMP-forming)/AMP-acid ligase II
MIYVHSLGRAFRYYPERKALAPGGNCLSFRDLEHRVAQVAAALSRQGFGVGDRLAFLLPNGPEYIELVYACGRLGIIAVPLNTRLSPVEIDRALVDANPRGLVRHSTLPVPSTRIPWERVLDREPWEPSDDLPPEDFYDPEAILALIYTSGTTGRPKGARVSHANVLADLHNFNYWMRYREGGVYLHAAPIFHIADFPAMFAAAAFIAGAVWPITRCPGELSSLKPSYPRVGLAKY